MADRQDPTVGSAATRQRLIDAARELLTENGPAKLRVQDIARRAGLTTGALYAHFRDRQDLLAEAVRSAQDDYLAELVAPLPADVAERSLAQRLPVLQPVDGSDPAPQLAAVLVSALTGEFSPSAALLVESFAMAIHSDSAPALRSTAASLHESLMRQAESLHADGLLPADVPPAAFATFWAAVMHGSAVLAGLGFPRCSPEEITPLLLAVAKTMTVPGDDGTPVGR
ncbi:TetR/AcrR family transcriptional regulator [Streptomyces sp. NPDC050619]|uniref:TetR/AcrR family transcriptional regulator n=1 Tax=Streptomyces sp. NPDC050619 TaxID=3157214 RepID=UPI00342B5E74